MEAFGGWSLFCASCAQRGRLPAAREHSVHFISDYRFLNIIKSLACSGGSVSQSVGSYFSTIFSEKQKGGGAGQTNEQKNGLRIEEKEEGRHARGHTLTHTKKSPRETWASDAGWEARKQREHSKGGEE